MTNFKKLDVRIIDIDYFVYYDADVISEEQMLKHCELISYSAVNKSDIYELDSHFLIVPTTKLPILNTIWNSIFQEGYHEGQVQIISNIETMIEATKQDLASRM